MTPNPLTCSAAAFPARISATPAREQDSPGRARVFGQSTPALLANFDPDTCSWRTSQLCLLEGSALFSETWPRSGLMRSGIASRLPPLAPLTAGTGSGSSRIPTPTVGDSKSAANATAGRTDPNSKHHSGTTLIDFVRTWPTPDAAVVNLNEPARLVAGAQGTGEGEGAERQRLRDAARGGGANVADAPHLGYERSGPAWSRRAGLTDGGGGVGAEWWAVEPDGGRVAHGVLARVDRLRALGNALVPQIAEWIGHRVLDYEAAA